MIQELVIISGKGGTGKTSVTAALASLAGEIVLCDADVDAADLHLLMAPEVRQRHDFMGGSLAVIQRDECTLCGKCRDLCRFEAISKDYVVDPVSCEGCGVCVDLCPERAITFPVQQCGEWFVSDTRFGQMVHARLGIGEENSGKLVSLVRQQARKVAEASGRQLLLTDGPPGIGCPVIAALGGATAVLIIVEPTVSGLHDMQRVAELATHFKIPGFICVNKYDLNLEMTAKIEAYGQEKNMVLVGRIGFDPLFVEAMIEGKNVVEYAPDSPAAKSIALIWQKLRYSPVMNRLGIKDLSAIIQ